MKQQVKKNDFVSDAMLQLFIAFLMLEGWTYWQAQGEVQYLLSPSGYSRSRRWYLWWPRIGATRRLNKEGKAHVWLTWEIAQEHILSVEGV